MKERSQSLADDDLEKALASLEQKYGKKAFWKAVDRMPGPSRGRPTKSQYLKEQKFVEVALLVESAKTYYKSQGEKNYHELAINHVQSQFAAAKHHLEAKTINDYYDEGRKILAAAHQ
jgi:hypothetical protein